MAYDLGTITVEATRLGSDTSGSGSSVGSPGLAVGNLLGAVTQA